MRLAEASRVREISTRDRIAGRIAQDVGELARVEVPEWVCARRFGRRYLHRTSSVEGESILQRSGPRELAARWEAWRRRAEVEAVSGTSEAVDQAR